MEGKQTGGRRMPYIDGIRGLLCVFIMLGHFWHIYYGIEGEAVLNHWLLDAIEASTWSAYLLSATFWLYAFMVISGYLLAFSNVTGPKQLLGRCVKRFLRLFIPIFGACLIIYVIQKTIGFHVENMQAYFRNGWLEQYYRAELGKKAVIRESFRAMFSADCAFNPPYWVISYMYTSSLIAYLCQYADHLAGRRLHLPGWMALLYALYIDKQVIIACLAGYLLGYYRKEMEALARRMPVFLAVCASVYAAFAAIRMQGILPRVFDGVMLYILMYCCLLTITGRYGVLQKLLSARPLLLAGKISFGVFSFHWPVICSVGLLVLAQGLEGQINVLAAFAAALICSAVCTVILSVLYHMTVEKLTEKVIGCIRL